MEDPEAAGATSFPDRSRKRRVAVLVAILLALVLTFALVSGVFPPFIPNPPPGATAFAIADVSTTSITSSGANIVWATNQPADTQVEYGTAVPYDNVSALDPAMATSHGVTLSTLQAGTLYHYRAMSRNATGTLAISGDLTFVTLTAPGAPREGIWIGPAELAALPTAGPAWDNVRSQADQACGVPNLSNQDDPTNVCVLAKALAFGRTGQTAYRDGVVAALIAIVNSGTYVGRALALGRELGTYAIAADLIDLKGYDPTLDASFRAKILELRTTPTSGGPTSLVECHEVRPNNWGLHCGASRVAVARYLGDAADLERVAQVFRGWLGNRSVYAGFTYGDLSWQCDPSAPVGINPRGCTKQGHSIDGVLPDDQRRAGTFIWPPPQENYVYEALQGALVTAVILYRAGYDTFNWSDQALLRAFQWLHTEASYPAAGDDTWQPHLVNFYYGTGFPAPIPSSPGKNMGWTDWTHAP